MQVAGDKYNASTVSVSKESPVIGRNPSRAEAKPGDGAEGSDRWRSKLYFANILETKIQSSKS